MPWTSLNLIELLETDSTSELASQKVRDFLSAENTPVLVVLDSNHSHDHVLKELELFNEILPVGSIVMVADTIIEEMPEDYYVDRPWNKGSNPLTAVNQFLKSNDNFLRDERWSRRSLMGECRDGIIIKTG